jgi:glycosyltransferase involved in cell wall biosynthesis
MRIGVDATCWQNTRGYGRYARSLLRALVQHDKQNEYTFFLDSEENTETLPGEATVRLVRLSAPTSVAASSNGHRSAGDMWRMSREMSKARMDILLFPTIYSYVPVFSRAKKIVTIMDVIAEKYPRLTHPNRMARLFWKTKVAFGRWQADAVASISEYSRQGIIEHFHIPADRVSVVSPASDPVFRVIENPILTPHLRALGLRENEPFITYVGGFSPHKNLEGLVRAFAELASQKEFSDVRLVMVGEYRNEVFNSYFETIKSEIEKLGLAARAVFTGYLSDEALTVLLNLSTVLVLPSFIEGFGLPAVEAAACGCPVIATSASPLPTLLGEGGLYFNPQRTRELEAALIAVLESETLRRKMSKAGREAASKLTWEAAAQQMVDLIGKVAAQ